MPSCEKRVFDTILINLNKLVGEEPTPVMPEEMERLVKDLPRDPEIVELFKKINAADPLPPR